MKNKALFLLFISLFIGCKKDGLKSVKIYLRSYVMEYYDMEHIILASGQGIFTYPDKYFLEIKCVIDPTSGVGYNDEGQKKQQYDVLCEKHGDMTFNRVILKHRGESVDYIGVDFSSVKVVSDADFDYEHPAGTILNDICTTLFYTAKEYIDSGYTEYNFSRDLCKYSILEKKLSEVSEEDLILLGTGLMSSHSGPWGHRNRLVDFRQRTDTLQSTQFHRHNDRRRRTCVLRLCPHDFRVKSEPVPYRDRGGGFHPYFYKK